MTSYVRCVIGLSIQEGRGAIGADVVTKYFYRMHLIKCIHTLINDTSTVSFAYVIGIAIVVVVWHKFATKKSAKRNQIH